MRACASAALEGELPQTLSAPSTGPRPAMQRCTSRASSCACAYRISKRSPSASPRRSTQRSSASFDSRFRHRARPLDFLEVLLAYLDTGALAWHAAQDPGVAASALRAALAENLTAVRGAAAQGAVFPIG
jgi:hypothetical protein